MKHTDSIKAYCKGFSLSYLGQRVSQVILQAQEDKPTYTEFLESILKTELELRVEHITSTRVKMVRLPHKHNLDEYDFSFDPGISERQLRELRQLNWLDRIHLHDGGACHLLEYQVHIALFYVDLQKDTACKPSGDRRHNALPQ